MANIPTEVKVVAYWPAISGAFRTTQEGGARVTFELDPIGAAKVFPLYLATTIQDHEETFELVLRRMADGRAKGNP